ncbi:MAG: CHRD domain-containing protein [candidate division WOR-3 bacterium]|uniref:CHRD domain-containing protein n=1 Tax=candidate division WOR-3 bacterium TaxID=2052148 RepID=A0A7C3IVF7_UNCW3|nr:CHRD domain-containing protein [candidate division WOR-3 bacterium]
MLRASSLVFCLLAILFLAVQAEASYSAQLTGNQAVPPTTSSATGDAVFTPNRDNTELKCKVTVNNLYNDGLLQVALYLGKPGEPAQPDMKVAVLPVTRSLKRGIYNGVLSQTTLTDADLQGPLAGHKIETLIFAMSMGKIFVNISSGSYPEGEIRGQIQ